VKVINTGLVDHIINFIEALKDAGIPISVSDKSDCFQAINTLGLKSRTQVKAAMASSLIKRSTYFDVFDELFSIYFPGQDSDQIMKSGTGLLKIATNEAAEAMSNEDFQDSLKNVLSVADLESMRAMASLSVSKFSKIDSSRPVGSSYYVYQTVRALGLEDVVDQLSDEISGSDATDFEKRLSIDQLKRISAEFRKLIEAEIRRRLVLAKDNPNILGVGEQTVVEDKSFIYASQQEMRDIKKALAPMAQRMAVRLARKRKKSISGSVDIKKTIRSSLSNGGVPVDIKYKGKRPTKPQIFIVADISGSVASFARFTLYLIHGLSSQFSKVRSFVFIDGLDEVSHIFESADVNSAILRVSSEADVIWTDGHSNYGHALEVFNQKYVDEIDSKSTVIVLGDARNNYHETNSFVMKKISDKAKNLVWLNPEPKSYWDTGDSIISKYSEYCDQVYEVRNLRQLEKFVDSLV